MPKRFLLAVTDQGRQLSPIGPFDDDTQRLIRARRMYNDYAGGITFSRLDIYDDIPTLESISDDEIDKVDLFEVDPQFCPRCGGTNISVAVEDWTLGQPIGLRDRKMKQARDGWYAEAICTCPWCAKDPTVPKCPTCGGDGKLHVTKKEDERRTLAFWESTFESTDLCILAPSDLAPQTKPLRRKK